MSRHQRKGPAQVVLKKIRLKGGLASLINETNSMGENNNLQSVTTNKDCKKEDFQHDEKLLEKKGNEKQVASTL